LRVWVLNKLIFLWVAFGGSKRKRINNLHERDLGKFQNQTLNLLGGDFGGLSWESLGFNWSLGSLSFKRGSLDLRCGSIWGGDWGLSWEGSESEGACNWYWCSPEDWGGDSNGSWAGDKTGSKDWGRGSNNSWTKELSWGSDNTWSEDWSRSKDWGSCDNWSWGNRHNSGWGWGISRSDWFSGENSLTLIPYISNITTLQ
jgi:hypothetical protein